MVGYRERITDAFCLVVGGVLLSSGMHAHLPPTGPVGAIFGLAVLLRIVRRSKTVLGVVAKLAIFSAPIAALLIHRWIIASIWLAYTLAQWHETPRAELVTLAVFLTVFGAWSITRPLSPSQGQTTAVGIASLDYDPGGTVD
ncbi:hypothetical protein [Sorangium sp. So ce145]|uniref:hypothetical protein n=1 Tax=Sorangium sp. So ce145 TaxID=3133285 RepID=UPI003F61BFF2